MIQYRYLIVGGGMTADAAARGIRQVDANGTIGLISSEVDPPYNRPPLSKGLWKGGSLDTIWCDTAEKNVTLHLGRKATRLDPAAKQVEDDQGNFYSFDKLLLATGGAVRTASWDAGVIYFRTLGDYQKLAAMAEGKRSFAVIGGGFIGSELAAALKMNDQEVHLVFPENGIGARLFPPGLAQNLAEYYRQKGIDVLPGETVSSVERRGALFIVKLRNAQTSKEQDLEVDGVTAGLGIIPSVDLAVQAGLQVDNGIVVSETLLSSHPDIYAAGDVASVYYPSLGKRMRLEHEDAAFSMGKAAGYNMAGEKTPFTQIPFFYSDLFELGYEAVGEVDSRLEAFEDWREPYRKGVVYYLRDGRVRGVLLWNVWGQVKTARALIAEAGPFTAANLKARITG